MNKRDGIISIAKSVFYIFINTFLVVGLVSIGGGILEARGIDFEIFVEENEFLVDSILSLILALIYFFILLVKQGRSRKKYGRDFVYTRNFTFKDFIRGLSIILASAGITILWFILANNLSDKFPIIQESLNSFEDNFSGVSLGEENYIWIFLSIVLIGPILEELLLRGIVFGNMKNAMPIGLAIALNGIIFGIFHMNLVQGVYASIAGILLASIYYYTRSIGLVIILHIINNFLSTLPPIVYIKIPNIESIMNIAFIISIPIGIVGFMRMRREYLENSSMDLEFTKLI